MKGIPFKHVHTPGQAKNLIYQKPVFPVSASGTEIHTAEQRGSFLYIDQKNVRRTS